MAISLRSSRPEPEGRATVAAGPGATEQTRAQRVLVIGAGKRAHEAILPALHCLASGVELVGVVARTQRELSFYGGALEVETTTDVAAHDLTGVDTVIVAITRASVPSVIRGLAGLPGAGRVRVMLDTPGIDLGGIGITKLFGRFRRVVSSEDSVALPLIAASRRLIADGAIGAVRHVGMVHSGWRNHALASIRSLVGYARPRRITVRRWNPRWTEADVRFGRGVTASIVHPHVHGHGRTMIVGDRGVIADYPTGHAAAVRVDYAVEDGVYAGITVDGTPYGADAYDRALVERLPIGSMETPTLDTMFKIRGLIELIANENGQAYDVFDSIVDHQSFRIAERAGRFVDVPLPGGHSAFEESIRAIAAARGIFVRR